VSPVASNWQVASFPTLVDDGLCAVADWKAVFTKGPKNIRACGDLVLWVDRELECHNGPSKKRLHEEREVEQKARRDSYAAASIAVAAIHREFIRGTSRTPPPNSATLVKDWREIA
jgi:hypothetical protein